MDDFEDLWQTAIASERVATVSPELHRLLHKAYARLSARQPDLRKIKQSLEELLTFLADPTGRTAANCVATDLLFVLADPRTRWQDLPQELSLILDDLGGALHDTISAPDVASNFESLPEQLLVRVRHWMPN